MATPKKKKKPRKRPGIKLHGGSGRKVSDMLLELIEPFRKYTPDDRALEHLIQMAILAWNLTRLPEDKDPEAEINEFARTITDGPIVSLKERAKRLLDITVSPDQDTPDQATFKQITRDLMARKKRLFPHAAHVIRSYKLKTTENDIHLSVMSFLNNRKQTS